MTLHKFLRHLCGCIAVLGLIGIIALGGSRLSPGVTAIIGVGCVAMFGCGLWGTGELS